jgi:hypothetical protein
MLKNANSEMDYKWVIEFVIDFVEACKSVHFGFSIRRQDKLKNY